MHAAVEQAELESAERRVVSGVREALIQTGALFSGGFVVSYEHHHRVVQKARLFDRAHDFAHSVVERRDHRRVHAPLWLQVGEALHVLVRRVHRVMRRVERHVQEKRIRLVLPDELFGLRRDPLGQIPAVFENLRAVPP